jgi:uncharacterized protein (DUF433 family)
MLHHAPPFVVSDPEILGGTPCFAGTRVAVEAVIASLNAGMTQSQLSDWVPGITQAHVEAAREYLAAYGKAAQRPMPTSWRDVERKTVPRR